MENAIERSVLRVEAGESGERLDAFLARRDPRLSRSRYKALIQSGQVSVANCKLTDPNSKVAAGDLIEFAVPPPEDPHPEAERIPLAIVYEDEDLVVINKPPG